MEENNERILSELEQYVGKRDHLWVLGDWCFDLEFVDRFAAIPAERKSLVRGNHDNFGMDTYNKVFNGVYGLVKYKGMWLSHPPIHPVELRGKNNLHGHVHYHSVDDTRYFNCCPENLWPKYGRCVVNLDELRKHFSI